MKFLKQDWFNDISRTQNVTANNLVVLDSLMCFLGDIDGCGTPSLENIQTEILLRYYVELSTTTIRNNLKQLSNLDILTIHRRQKSSNFYRLNRFSYKSTTPKEIIYRKELEYEPYEELPIDGVKMTALNENESATILDFQAFKDKMAS